MIQADKKIQNAPIQAQMNEREMLLSNCSRLAGAARERCGGAAHCHLVGIYITDYLTSVGTPTALSLLNELQKKDFRGI